MLCVPVRGLRWQHMGAWDPREFRGCALAAAMHGWSSIRAHGPACSSARVYIWPSYLGPWSPALPVVAVVCSGRNGRGGATLDTHTHIHTHIHIYETVQELFFNSFVNKLHVICKTTTINNNWLRQFWPSPTLKNNWSRQCCQMWTFKKHWLQQIWLGPTFTNHWLRQYCKMWTLKNHWLRQFWPGPTFKSHWLGQCCKMWTFKYNWLRQFCPDSDLQKHCCKTWTFKNNWLRRLCPGPTF